MRHYALGIFALLVSPSTGCSHSRPQTAAYPAKAPGRYVESIRTGGFTRSYILRVPKTYDATKPVPLVMLLHGWTASARAIELASGMGNEADKDGFVLVVPDGLGNPGWQGWNSGFINLSGKQVDDVAFIDALITRVEGEVGIDPDRVFVTGHSNGAFLAHLLGAREGNRFAALAAVAGTIGIPKNGGGFSTIPEPVAPISVLIIHGRKDPMVQYDAASQSLLHGVGAMESAKWWAQRDGCATKPDETVTGAGNVITDTFSGGKNGTEVQIVSIANGTHEWPGGLSNDGPETTTGVNAADLIWSFFLAHPRKR